MERHRQVFSSVGLGLQTMMDYSHNHWSYIGLKGSHYFSGGKGKRTSAHMFNYDLLVKRGIIYDMEAINFPAETPVETKTEIVVKPEAEQADLPF